LAIELGGYGIRVNSVHPYGTDTPMGSDLSTYQVFQDLWLAGDGSSLVTTAQLPADKGYLKI
jgi:NAD(P)-dependent dehydrogenase (short-subunit alcohol dehydrogenase family)